MYRHTVQAHTQEPILHTEYYYYYSEYNYNVHGCKSLITGSVIDDVGEGSVEVQYVGVILLADQLFHVDVVERRAIVGQKVACGVVI